MPPVALPDPPADHYVDHVLTLYRATPGTTGRARPADRRLAADLQTRRVPLLFVEHALLLAAARRSVRPRGAPPLPPARSLHYFLPVIEELLAQPLDPDYVTYLRATLHRLP
jgi:hypothetical protein